MKLGEISTSDFTTIDECRRCGLKNARGTTLIFNDGAIDFKCDVCGRTMRMGYTEQSNLKQMESKRGRVRAEENRTRFQSEKRVQVNEAYGNMLATPKERIDFVNKALWTMNNPFSPYAQKDDGEIYSEKF